MDPFSDNLANLAEEKRVKTKYLKDYIIDYGYDKEDFNHYMSYQKEDGADIDNWTIDELSQCIRDYYAYCDEQQKQYYEQNPDQRPPEHVNEPPVHSDPHQQEPQEADLSPAEQKEAEPEEEEKIVHIPVSDKVWTEADFEDLKARNTP